MPTLKVFRTPIGFHDAYVAVPSQKAALEAYGADNSRMENGRSRCLSRTANFHYERLNGRYCLPGV